MPEAQPAMLRIKDGPGYQHNGKFSPWSKNFINGYSENWVRDQKVKTSTRMNTEETKKSNIFNFEHWKQKFPEDLN